MPSSCPRTAPSQRPLRRHFCLTRWWLRLAHYLLRVGGGSWCAYASGEVVLVAAGCPCELVPDENSAVAWPRSSHPGCRKASCRRKVWARPFPRCTWPLVPISAESALCHLEFCVLFFASRTSFPSREKKPQTHFSKMLALVSSVYFFFLYAYFLANPFVRKYNTIIFWTRKVSIIITEQTCHHVEQK